MRIVIYALLILEDLYMFLYQVFLRNLCERKKKRVRFSFSPMLVRQLPDIMREIEIKY